ncbi:MAG: methionyl-tRNA formyltransferase [Planctomycetota bacterium]|jgi:methionyl-tRNA formyltransferase
MRLVFLASGAFARPTLRRLADSEHDVPLVITQPARGSGRGRKVTRTPVRALADELGLETLEVEDVNSPETIARLRSVDASLGVVIAFGQKLGPEVLAALQNGCVNLHASLLPRHRGAAPINWAIINGDERSGCTVFRVVDRMDAGPILTTRWTYIKPEETAGELHDRLAAIGVDAIDAALAMFAGGESPEGTPQDDSQATRAPKLKKSDGIICFDQPAGRVANHICGMTPWPGASTKFHAADGRWEKTIITRVRQAEDLSKPSIPPGTLDTRLYVAAQDGFIEILELKPSSGREMTWPEFVNGRHVAQGDRFVAPDK